MLLNSDAKLFALTKANELHYCTSNERQWQQVEVEIDPGQEVVAIWSYPHHPDGSFLVRTERDDKYLFQQTSPPSAVTHVLQREGWKENDLPVNAGIMVVVADPNDAQALYAGTANDGVYRARITLPSLWEQIPADSPIKMAFLTRPLAALTKGK